MIRVGSALARAGYRVFIPRIPPLKALRLQDDILDWMRCAYNWILENYALASDRVALIGMSFGGALVLRLTLTPDLQSRLPRSLLVYGTFYDVRTAFDFLVSGRLDINGRTIHIQPNEWGLVVLFHNYLGRVDVGYPTDEVRQILSLRVKDDLEAVEHQVRTLKGPPRDLIEAILKPEDTPEIQRIMNLIYAACGDELDQGSPKSWCRNVNRKVFVMHGANDSMSPFTESIQLAQALPDSHLFISYLYEHREIATDRGWWFRLRELLRMLRFLNGFIAYNR